RGKRLGEKFGKILPRPADPPAFPSTCPVTYNSRACPHGAGGHSLSVPPPLIELADVSRWYGNFQALSAVSLRLVPGRVGLLGPTGAGKSPLLKALLGLLPPSSGTGGVRGRDITAGAELRRAVGYMPEMDGLVPGLAGVDYVGLA